MIKQIASAILAGALGILLGWLSQYSTVSQYRAEASELRQELLQERSNSLALRTRVSALTAQHRASKEDVEHALQENPGWSGTAVPPAVADSLCKHGNC